MRVTIWPAGDINDGTSQYRLFMPGVPLAVQGADIRIDWKGPVCTWNVNWAGQPFPPPEARVLAVKKPETDVIVMQRPGRRWWSDIIPFLKNHGIRVVVDIDDRFDKIDKGNAAGRQFDPRNSETFNYNWVAAACKNADLVTVTTPSLLETYGYGHGTLLPNLVPERYLQIADYKPTTLGWTGTTATHPKDLQVTAGAVGRVIDQYGWRFRVVGDGNGVQSALGLSEEPEVAGWVPFDRYAYEMAKMLVGIVPLAPTPFNDAKSALKMMEMAALGVPAVVSPTYDNRRMNEKGIGLLASNPQRWASQLSKLIGHREFRVDLAGRGREIMAKHTYERHCDRWWSAWVGKRGRST